MDKASAKQELLSQTAKISWEELQRFFAAGKLIYVSQPLDLIEVGAELIQDNKAQFLEWTQSQAIHPVNDEQAQLWSKSNPTLWAAAVSPWVLIQELKAE
ncbi:DUF2288 domain-containing protein [Marinagarivorans cellulosilyticus]|uniref:DUF2288 domain-containing protein n=1 Tax=Marinagarivorans cellulosilyticus TaxID=2721545 RepID=A0AAN1WIR5_9GAMM|nr:DUF2288 domain-containing protein [Marinagarivorans cellulosilyticus]BCD98393.1 hypothetical protein MARGE09_P2594 [Marinagarivorans cellulosilyticus]